jgi:serine/threonine protein kinase
MQPNLPIQHIGRYEIQSEPMRGGMSIVFRAYDPRFERHVAIKVLTQSLLSDPQLRVRFEREAKTIAKLEHPAIVPVYDVGEENGQPYIVMRYMAGGSLADRLKMHPLQFSEAVQIISRLAPALDAAHARGIVHRDLKPGNILFDQYGNAFLSDFGIARLTEQSATLTGDAVLGTPAYMSPEQVQGNKELDGRSDVYSLGIILYEMLSGILPYHGDTPAKTMLMHILDPIPSLLERKPDIPDYINEVVIRALAKNPDDRFANAGEMAAELRAISGEGDYKKTLAPISEVEASTVAVVPPQADQLTPAWPKRPAPATVVAQPSKPRAPVDQPIPTLPSAEPPARQAYANLWIVGLIILVLVGLATVGGGLYIAGIKGIGPLAQLRQPPAALMLTSTTQSSAIPTEAVDQAGTAEAARLVTVQAATVESIAVTATAGRAATAAAATSAAATDSARSIVQVSPTPKQAPTETPISQPTEPPVTSPGLPVIGDADQIAFIANREIWVMNVDGSQLVQVTRDGALKTGLQWSPDGTALIYLSANCVNSVSIDEGRFDTLACFSPPNTLDEFEISPDGSQVAVGLNHELFIVPYDLPGLLEAKKKSDLVAMADCPALAPYAIHGAVIAVNSVRWSNDQKRLAIVREVPSQGIRVDMVHVLDISSCLPEIPRLDEFPGSRFTLYERDIVPEIQNLAYDGDDLFALFSSKRNGGFGELWIYNTDLHKADKIAPIENTCCYRDPEFSPDGRYLLFAFQSLRLAPNSPIQLYYIPVGTVGSGMTYAPLPLPADIFSDQRSRPEPVLRPAK